jgi:hypothetical protein
VKRLLSDDEPHVPDRFPSKLEVSGLLDTGASVVVAVAPRREHVEHRIRTDAVHELEKAV